MFAQISLKPRVPDAPDVMLFCRDLMKAAGVPKKVKDIYLDHAEHWLSPQNGAVVVHQIPPPILLEDVKMIRTKSVKTRSLCWSAKDIKSFLTIESACAPCITRATPEFWRGIDNHNRTCERYVGRWSYG